MAMVKLESDFNSFLPAVYSIRCVLHHLELQGIAGMLSSPPYSCLWPPVLWRVLLYEQC